MVEVHAVKMERRRTLDQSIEVLSQEQRLLMLGSCARRAVALAGHPALGDIGSALQGAGGASPPRQELASPATRRLQARLTVMSIRYANAAALRRHRTLPPRHHPIQHVGRPPGLAPGLRIVFVSSNRPRRCGLASFSADLMAAIKATDPRVACSVAAIDEPNEVRL